MYSSNGKNSWNVETQKKILDSLLPNSINMEFIRSLDSIRNGTDMKYFLTYFERVSNAAVSVLLIKD